MSSGKTIAYYNYTLELLTQINDLLKEICDVLSGASRPCERSSVFCHVSSHDLWWFIFFTAVILVPVMLHSKTKQQYFDMVYGVRFCVGNMLYLDDKYMNIVKLRHLATFKVLFYDCGIRFLNVLMANFMSDCEGWCETDVFVYITASRWFAHSSYWCQSC